MGFGRFSPLVLVFIFYKSKSRKRKPDSSTGTPGNEVPIEGAAPGSNRRNRNASGALVAPGSAGSNRNAAMSVAPDASLTPSTLLSSADSQPVPRAATEQAFTNSAYLGMTSNQTSASVFPGDIARSNDGNEASSYFFIYHSV
ncbi:unnamed protein product [Protopolystoma xenopodis]|uniref:Uncharacterized protein n=1 Tax=Protopolystoma xenopodis TaxID=117903 RepID=A0A448WP77_9PLAT|nr:unnamed protein product [Protopolystoma xenopodis]